MTDEPQYHMGQRVVGFYKGFIIIERVKKDAGFRIFHPDNLKGMPWRMTELDDDPWALIDDDIGQEYW